MLPYRPDIPVRPLLLSIHDVMPATLEQTHSIMARLKSFGYRRVTLLVVPGSGWQDDTLDSLRTLVEDGAELAGHGWVHRVDRIRGIRHRVHSALLSRNVAEHLALDVPGRVALMQRCFDWFAEQALPTPALYVPPAWAMGPMPKRELGRLPFRQHETLGGVYDVKTMRFRRLAMVGFEADTAFRAASCRLWNWLNDKSAGRSRPLRIAIHPHDFELSLGRDLNALLAAGGKASSYHDLYEH